MVLYFKTRKLAKNCNSQIEATKTFGQQCAQKLMQRLMELQAALVLSDISHLPPPRLHELTGQRKGQFLVDLKHPYRLLFIPANDPISLKEDGGINLSKVTEIEIINIEDTH